MVGCPYCVRGMVPTMEITGADYCFTCRVFWFASGPALALESPGDALTRFLERWDEIARELPPVLSEGTAARPN